MATLKGISASSAMKSTETMRILLSSIIDRLNLYQALLEKWFPGIVDEQSAGKAFLQPPPNAKMNIAGSLGTFIINITNPQSASPISALLDTGAVVNAARLPIYHEVSSATSATFDSSNNLVIYPVTDATRFDITDPSKTRYFRIRSSFDQKNWNNYTYFSGNPVSSGYVTLLNDQGVAGAITGNSADLTVYTVPVPGNTLGINGNSLWIRAWFTQTGTDVCTYKLTYGGTVIHQFTNNTTNPGFFEAEIRRASATTVDGRFVLRVFGSSLFSHDDVNFGQTVTLSSNQALTFTFNVANTTTVTPKGWSIVLKQ